MSSLRRRYLIKDSKEMRGPACEYLEKYVLGRETSKHQSPGTGMGLVCQRNNKEINVGRCNQGGAE